VLPAALHLEHQVRGSYRAWYAQRRPHQNRVLGLAAQEIEGVGDSNDLIQ